MADEEKPKKSPLKWILLLVILLLLGGGGYFAYLKFFSGSDQKPAEQQTEGQAAEQAAPEQGEHQVVTLPTFLVNLADPLGRRYLKMTIDVEVVGPEAADDLNKNMPKVRDAIILLLSSKTYADLATLENKTLLKMEIVKKLNLVLGKPDVSQVYFTEMVIQ